MKRGYLFLFLIVLLTLPFSIALAQDVSVTLRLTTFLDIGNLHPILGGQTYINRLTWSRLYEIDTMTGQPIPGLTSWEISEDGLTYTFKIRDDAKWHDGTPITANDVKFTFDAINSPLVETWGKTYFPPAVFNALTVVDDKTFTVKQDKVNCTFLSRLNWFIPMPAHLFKPDFTDFSNHPSNTEGGIGSGPYITVEYKPDEFIRFKANPNYWGGEPKIKNITMRFEGDTAVTNLAMQAGELDLLRMTASQYEQLVGKENFTTYTMTNQFIATLLLNQADPANPMPAYDENGNLNEQPPHPVLGDVRVRQAIAMGYDKDAILASIQDENAGTRVKALFHPVLNAWADNPDVELWPYDPGAAAALLDEAGWVMNDSTGLREKDGLTLGFTITYSPIYSEYNNIALVIQDQLGQLGFKVETSVVEYGTLISEFLNPQTFDAVVLSFGTFPADPDGNASAFLLSENDIPKTGGNYTSVVNPEVDRLIKEGVSVPGCAPEDRAPIYHQLQKIARDNVLFGDWNFVTNDYMVVGPRLKGFLPAPAAGEGGEFWNIVDWTLE